MSPALALFLAGACTRQPADTADSGPDTVPWSGDLPPIREEIPALRGLEARRAIVHFHSPWSHDACDGEPLPDGVPNEPCLETLRDGLCRESVDFAFSSDHASYAAEQSYEALFLQRDGDAWVEVGGSAVANRIDCGPGQPVTWMPGIEGGAMPLALDRQVAETADERYRLYGSESAEAIAALQAAGATLCVAHTEGRDLASLETLQDLGLRGVEVFNLHAMFAPDIREEDLGLDPWGWATAIAPFTSPDGTAEPDLLFLGVLQEQAPSVARWDALLARGPMAGVLATDAHQNVLPLVLRDGDRVDSYRRMFRWFSNVLLVDGDGPADAEEALASGRLYGAFEVLGTPAGFDLHLVDDTGATWEMGTDAPAGTLHVACPVLSDRSPHGDEDPEVRVTVFRDGQPWRTTCGDFAADGPATFRARVDIVPWHLRPFLGDDPDPWLVPWPWVYSGAIRVGVR